MVDIRAELLRYKDIISEALDVSEKMGLKTYIVGGLVRDILLGIETTDIDFVVEGDVRELSKELLRRFRGRNYRYLERFGTSSFEFEKDRKEYRIDLARARREEYPTPGEHPVVRFVDDVKIDLLRRDFKINAMAMEVTRDFDFRIIDVVAGLKDISERKISVLHLMSISDDPTRILRGVRISLKLGFALDTSVLESLEIAKRTGAFRKVHGSRFFSEFKIAAKEDFFGEFLKKLNEMSVLTLIHPALSFKEFKFSGTWKDKIAELISRIPPTSRYEVTRFFGVSKDILSRIRETP